MVRDFISSNNCNYSFRPQRISDCVKKIGSYIGKFKNTLGNFQREVSSVTKDVEIDDEIIHKKGKN